VGCQCLKTNQIRQRERHGLVEVHVGGFVGCSDGSMQMYSPKVSVRLNTATANTESLLTTFKLQEPGVNVDLGGVPADIQGLPVLLLWRHDGAGNTLHIGAAAINPIDLTAIADKSNVGGHPRRQRTRCTAA